MAQASEFVEDSVFKDGRKYIAESKEEGAGRRLDSSDG